ncbi:metallophosphoesterase family protein [Sediminicola luteus]|uniref:Metallophosphoesterase n=1 Tax=Sediminicola luteus TaxID=319238 RepID=A0A2A4G7L1_9FLAO|nr:metallophosphoesterase [Sediminicola luteus]PCE63735.1 metallophosphoesterase [Sediminicola luteus]
MDRRKFSTTVSKGIGAMLLPTTQLSFTPKSQTGARDLQFGIITDVHKDLMPDADARLASFIKEAQAREVDFIIQLGDFCMAKPENDGFMAIWNQFKGPKYHVLGNHDMDAHSKTEMLAYWQMPQPYYSFDQNGFHFIVLDANFLYKDGTYIDYEKANFYIDGKYRTFIDEAQLKWLAQDLAQNELPTLVFSHQSLWHYEWGVKNRLQVQQLLEAHSEKIVCCLNGHNHIDFHHQLNGIDYIEVNSASYHWMAPAYKNTERFPKALYEKHKYLSQMATYQDALFAFVRLDPRGKMELQGTKSQWVAPSPEATGMPLAPLGNRPSPEISDYGIPFS